jgi:hypothetical protein
MDLETMQIHINSRWADSFNNNSLSDCNFYLPHIDINPQCQIYISVVHAVIPYSFYNIDDSNNILIYNENSQTYQIVIISGNYTANQLVAYLTNVMNNFTVTYNSITNKFTFINSLYDFTFSTSSTCFDIIGFSASETMFLSSNNKILVSEYCINMAQNQCICIGSNFQTGNISLNGDRNKKSIICSIPLESQPFSLITYKNSTTKVNLYSNNLAYINIKLLNQDGKLLNLNGKYFSLTLQLDIINFVD